MSVAHIEPTRFTKHNGDRAKTAAVLQEALHLPLPWWKQLFKWEANLTVAGRTIEKGIVLTPTMCLTLILAIAAMMGTVYWRMSDRIDAKDNAYQEQRDMLVEIKTELKIRKEHDSEKMEQIEKRFQNIDAVQIVLGRDIAKINAQRGN